MENKSWYLTEVELKSFKSARAQTNPSKGGNGMLWDGSHNVSVLKVSSKLWSETTCNGWEFDNSSIFIVMLTLTSGFYNTSITCLEWNTILFTLSYLFRAGFITFLIARLYIFGLTQSGSNRCTSILLFCTLNTKVKGIYFQNDESVVFF